MFWCCFRCRRQRWLSSHTTQRKTHNHHKHVIYLCLCLCIIFVVTAWCHHSTENPNRWTLNMCNHFVCLVLSHILHSHSLYGAHEIFEINFYWFWPEKWHATTMVAWKRGNQSCSIQRNIIFVAIFICCLVGGAVALCTSYLFCFCWRGICTLYDGRIWCDEYKLAIVWQHSHIFHFYFHPFLLFFF